MDKDCKPEADFLRQSYFYDLPARCIAQTPAPDRSASRLMVLCRTEDGLKTGLFSDLLTCLPEKCLLVANNSRVVKVRLAGRREQGGRVEVLLSPPLHELQNPPPGAPKTPGGQEHSVECAALLRPVKKLRLGERISFAPDFYAFFLERGDWGRGRLRLFWKGDLSALLERFGQTPLPPYIRRQAAGSAGSALAATSRESGVLDARNLDAERYQTVYARADKTGSMAAPTAGLHFTLGLREALLASGREWAELSLYVGYGTFSPVRCEDIRDHVMHEEYVQIPVQTAGAVQKAKSEGRAVIAVGTTSARALEAAFAEQNALVPFAGPVNIFLYPGQIFHVIDGLITNFHLPESSLLMLVSALAGRERILSAYQEAIRLGFRFFSYGDAMLIL